MRAGVSLAKFKVLLSEKGKRNFLQNNHTTSYVLVFTSAEYPPVTLQIANLAKQQQMDHSHAIRFSPTQASAPSGVTIGTRECCAAAVKIFPFTYQFDSDICDTLILALPAGYNTLHQPGSLT